MCSNTALYVPPFHKKRNLTIRVVVRKQQQLIKFNVVALQIDAFIIYVCLSYAFQMKHCHIEDPSDVCSINISGLKLTDANQSDFHMFDNVVHINAGENYLPFGLFCLSYEFYVNFFTSSLPQGHTHAKEKQHSCTVKCS